MAPGSPWAICVSGGPTQYLYLADAFPGRIYKLSLDGKLLGYLGRAGHQVGAPSVGKLFPRYRGDLLQTAVVAEGMLAADIESTRYPRNPLDVLAQQLLSDVTGVAFPKLMHDSVLAPLGMTLSTYEQPLPAARLDVECMVAAVDGEVDGGLTGHGRLAPVA